MAAALLTLAGLWLAVTSGTARTLTAGDVAFIATVLAVLFVSLGLMRWGGPLIVELITGAEYRPQHNTTPWKYFDFVLGGTTIITTLIFIIKHQFH